MAKGKKSVVEKTLKGLTRKAVRKAFLKTKQVNIRMTERDKTAIETAAKSCDLTLTEFLTRSALFVAERLERG